MSVTFQLNPVGEPETPVDLQAELMNKLEKALNRSLQRRGFTDDQIGGMSRTSLIDADLKKLLLPLKRDPEKKLQDLLGQMSREKQAKLRAVEAAAQAASMGGTRIPKERSRRTKLLTEPLNATQSMSDAGSTIHSSVFINPVVESKQSMEQDLLQRKRLAIFERRSREMKQSERRPNEKVIRFPREFITEAEIRFKQAHAGYSQMDITAKGSEVFFPEYRPEKPEEGARRPSLVPGTALDSGDFLTVPQQQPGTSSQSKTRWSAAVAKASIIGATEQANQRIHRSSITPRQEKMMESFDNAVHLFLQKRSDPKTGKYAWKKLKQRMTEEDRYELQLAIAQAEAVANEKDVIMRDKLANTPLKRNLVKELKEFITFAQEHTIQGKPVVEADAKKEAELREKELQAATGPVPPSLITKLASTPDRQPGAWYVYWHDKFDSFMEKSQQDLAAQLQDRSQRSEAAYHSPQVIQHATEWVEDGLIGGRNRFGVPIYSPGDGKGMHSRLRDSTPSRFAFPNIYDSKAVTSANPSPPGSRKQSLSPESRRVSPSPSFRMMSSISMAQFPERAQSEPPGKVKPELWNYALQGALQDKESLPARRGFYDNLLAFIKTHGSGHAHEVMIVNKVRELLLEGTAADANLFVGLFEFVGAKGVALLRSHRITNLMSYILKELGISNRQYARIVSCVKVIPMADGTETVAALDRRQLMDKLNFKEKSGSREDIALKRTLSPWLQSRRASLLDDPLYYSGSKSHPRQPTFFGLNASPTQMFSGSRSAEELGIHTEAPKATGWKSLLPVLRTQRDDPGKVSDSGSLIGTSLFGAVSKGMQLVDDLV